MDSVSSLISAYNCFQTTAFLTVPHDVTDLRKCRNHTQSSWFIFLRTPDSSCGIFMLQISAFGSSEILHWQDLHVKKSYSHLLFQFLVFNSNNVTGITTRPVKEREIFSLFEKELMLLSSNYIVTSMFLHHFSIYLPKCVPSPNAFLTESFHASVFPCNLKPKLFGLHIGVWEACIVGFFLCAVFASPSFARFISTNVIVN